MAIIINVYHRTLERNLHNILSNGLDTRYRGNQDGYTKNNLVFECDKRLDLLNEELSLNKPKRLKSNYAWLNLESAKKINLRSDKKEVILRLEVDPSMVFVSHQLLWQAAYQSSKYPGFNLPNTSFEDIGLIYWLNVISIDTFLQNNPELDFPNSFNDELKNCFRNIWDNKNSYEVMIPNWIAPSNISVLSHC